MNIKRNVLGSWLVVLVLITFPPTILQSTGEKSGSSLMPGREDNLQITKGVVAQNMGRMPLAFTKNEGQWDEQVLFRANAGGATMWFTREGTYYQFTRRIPRTDAEPLGPHQEGNRSLDVGMPDRDKFDNEPDSTETMAIKASFIGANPDLEVVGEELMEYKCNYFIGNDPAEWRTDVPNYRAVRLKEVYAGIDLRYYGNGRQMEYDFIISPGADPYQIKIKYEGAKSLSVNEAGELEVETGWNRVTEQAPYVYQETAGGRRDVVGKYHLLENKTFGFVLKEEYDSSLPLIIDPILVYSTYLGGGSTESCTAVALDTSGNVYVTGNTTSGNYPIENFYQTNQGGMEVFVTKLSNFGDGLVYSTYLGGIGNEGGEDIAIDITGNAYVTGWTESPDFPTENPFQPDQGGTDVFVTKLSNTGNRLIYSTYLGGISNEYGYGIAIDRNGNAYVTGVTWSYNFPTESYYQRDPSYWYADIFVTKLSSFGDDLIYSTYLGGSHDEWGKGDIAVDTAGNAYVIGSTNSSDFPTANPYMSYQGGSPYVIVTKLSNSGNWSSPVFVDTWLGGFGRDLPLKLDRADVSQC